MRTNAQFTAERLRRIREFLQRQPVTIAVGDLKEPMARLDDAIASIEAVGSSSDQRRRSSIAATGRIYALTKVARTQYMLPLQRAAAHLFPDDPSVRNALKVPTRTRPRAIVDTLRGMADAAEPYTTALAAAGFAPDFVKRMQTVADSIKSVLDARARETALRTGATAGKRASIRTARSLVRLLDAHVAPRLDDPALHAEWKSLLRQGIRYPRATEPTDTTPTGDGTTSGTPEVPKAA